MSHLQQNRKLLNRINRLQGQLNAVQQAVSGGQVSCIDILQQVAAIRGALAGLTNELVEEQLPRHVLTEGYNTAELQRFLQVLRHYG